MTTLYCEARWDSPFVFTAFVALVEKGLAFEARALDLEAREQRREDFARDSLTARVPTLEHQGFWLSESTAIVEYLDEIVPAPAPRLLPESVEERARARQILGWLRSDLAALRRERPSSTIFYGPENAPLGEAARADADKLLRVSAQLLEGRASLFASFSIADADLAFALMRLLANGDAVPPHVEAYAKGVWQRPSVQAFVKRSRP